MIWWTGNANKLSIYLCIELDVFECIYDLFGCWTCEEGYNWLEWLGNLSTILLFLFSSTFALTLSYHSQATKSDDVTEFWLVF